MPKSSPTRYLVEEPSKVQLSLGPGFPVSAAATIAVAAATLVAASCNCIFASRSLVLSRGTIRLNLLKAIACKRQKASNEHDTAFVALCYMIMNVRFVIEAAPTQAFGDESWKRFVNNRYRF